MRNDEQFESAEDENPFNIVGLLKSCTTTKDLVKGSKLHGYIRDHNYLAKNVYVGSALVNMYAKSGALGKAQRVLKELPVRNAVTWNALIAGYAQQGQGKEALRCFDDMMHEGHSPRAVTFVCALKACGSIGAAAKGEEIHEKIVSLGMLGKNVVLGTAVVDMYARCGALSKAQRVLKELPVRDAVSWCALIAGCAQQGEGEEALKCFDSMLCEGHSPTAVTFICVLKACASVGAAAKGKEIHDKIVSLGLLKKDIVLGTTLVDMYVKCGALDKAQQALEDLPLRDVISWSALIAGYAQQGQSLKAIKCFERMQSNGVKPDSITLASVLSACSHTGLLNHAETYFSEMSTKYGIHPSLEHYNCMTDLFGRAGKFDKALWAIAEMPSDKRLLSWVALLGACRKWGEVRIGRLAFEHVLCLDKSNSAAYALMVDIYTTAGMQEKAQKIEVMRVTNKAWKDVTFLVD